MSLAILLVALALWVYTTLVGISDQIVLLGAGPISLNIYDVEILALLVGIIAGITGRFLGHKRLGQQAEGTRLE